MSTLLVADIGGTKSDLAVFEKGSLNPLIQARYINTDFGGGDEVIEKFLQDHQCSPSSACLAIAAIVAKGRAVMTNLPWVFEEDKLSARFKLTTVSLINDMTAVARSLPSLGQNDLFCLQPGKPADGVCGAVCPGTGLGEGFLVAPGEIPLAIGSEGGHTGFSPQTDEQLELLAWKREKGQHVNCESFISGPGIASLYDFYVERVGIEPFKSTLDEVAGKVDRTPAILHNALLESPCPACKSAVELFLTLLGSEAGNLALKLYATGGIYLGGGILPRLAGKVSFVGLVQSFNDKGLMSSLMSTIPLHMITYKNSTLRGALLYAMSAEKRAAR
jgi:glucokinase